MAATTPNSTSIVLLVKYRTPKPMAVVILARNRVMPIVSMVRASAFTLLPCMENSLWYVLMRTIQVGRPITIMSGAIRPLSTVILYPKSSMIPMDQTTPMITTISENTTVEIERKSSQRMMAVTITARIRKRVISPLTLVMSCALI